MEVDSVKINKVLDNLKKCGFKTQHFATGAEAAVWMADQIEPGQLVYVPGSDSVRSVGVWKMLEDKGVEVISHTHISHEEPERRRKVMIRSFEADALFCSANALLEDGSIYNCDGTGSRIAASIFGPPRVFFLIGSNKIVKDLDEANERVKKLGPKICDRTGRITPCRKTHECSDCYSNDRSCRIYALMRRRPRDTDITVILTDEALGM